MGGVDNDKESMMDYVKDVFYVFMCGECGGSDDSDQGTLRDATKDVRDRGWIIGKDRNICHRCLPVKREATHE